MAAPSQRPKIRRASSVCLNKGNGTMEIRLDGRVALITGGSKGLGLATAICMSASGADVAIVARDAATLAAAEETIRATAKGKVASFMCDVAKPEEIKTLYGAVVAKFGKVDILLNNAGAHMSG